MMGCPLRNYIVYKGCNYIVYIVYMECLSDIIPTPAYCPLFHPVLLLQAMRQAEEIKRELSVLKKKQELKENEFNYLQTTYHL